MKNLGVKKGHLSQGHSPLLLVVLLLSCFGCCNADAFPQSPKTPFSGNVSGLFWGDGNLAANRYHLCPTGTLPAVPSLMVLTSHGHAGQQLLHAADDRSFITIKSLASLLRLRAGFPAPRCKRAASLATLAIRQCGIHVGFPWRFVPNTIFCFMWFFHWISRSKSRRKRQKHKKRCGIHHGKRKPTSFGTKFGPCRWIKGRRFRVKKKKYRLLGLQKRRTLLFQLRRERFTGRRVSTRPRQVQSSPFGKVVSWLCGWLGIRVGEARHPGPRGGNQTKRKADDADLADTHQDSHLAQALLQVLQNFQQDKRVVRPGGNPQKKGKGGPAPKKGGSRLAHILLQTLQSAVSQGWSDETVAQRMVNKITRHAPHENMFEESSGNSFVSPPENSLSDSKQSLGERLYPKVFAVTPEHAGKVTGMFLEWPAAEVQRLLHSDKVLKDKIQEALSCLNKAQSPGKGKAKAGTWHQTAHQTWADKAREGHKFQDSKAKGKGKDSSQRGTPRFAAQVNPCEWSEKPEVTTLPRIQKALTEGLVFPGNLIVTRDEEVAKEASNIFNAFGCQNQKLTVAVVGGQAKGPSICVWWSPSKSLNLPAQRIPARLFQIGSSNGPVLKPAAVVTNFPKPLGDKLVTIRFLSPAFYRKHIPGICQDDTPKSVIAAWAQMTGLQASTFTGGRWEIAKHGHGSILIGHVKMTKEQADKCLPLSGRNALFVTQVPLVDNKKAVAWIPRNSAPLEEYFRQAFTQAQARKAPLVLRQGGGSDLGLLGVEASELGNKFQTRMWELFGAPKHWSDVDVKAFVCQNSWCDVQVVNKIRRGPHFLWLFKARRADNQGEASENSWHYKDQDGNLFLSIGSARPRTRKQPVVEQLVAPKKSGLIRNLFFLLLPLLSLMTSRLSLLSLKARKPRTMLKTRLGNVKDLHVEERALPLNLKCHLNLLTPKRFLLPFTKNGKWWTMVGRATVPSGASPTTSVWLKAFPCKARLWSAKLAD